ncbi:hypothetical protein NFC81_09135 [Salinispirillum sp. LH 10-3-1]|uniref:DUF2802 domain-containing protein n=1 Tax=Salinispirillum sp. LH 10-3-1 TaxID=2952525 RepID=A0AB38YCX7_9GAMM
MINLAPFAEYFVLLLMTAVSALAMPALIALRDKLKIDQDSQLASTMDNGLHLALKWAETQMLLRGQKLTIETRHQFIADAANYVAENFPGIMKHFGITPERLQHMIEARTYGRLGNDNPPNIGSSGSVSGGLKAA